MKFHRLFLKISDFHLTHSLSLTLLTIWLNETSCHILSCPMKRPTWQGSEGGFQLTSKKLTLSATTHDEWDLPNNQWENSEFKPALTES